MIPIIDAILIALAISALMTIVSYPKRRDIIEATCIKESKLKSFVDEFILNALLSLVLLLVIVILYILIGVFE